jgi:hypothetical protein
MPPSGVDYASEFLNGYAPEYVVLVVILVRGQQVNMFTSQLSTSHTILTLPYCLTTLERHSRSACKS